MNSNRRNGYLLLAVLLIIYLLFTSTTCARILRFQNCTNDTLFIGASLYNSMDSMKYVVLSEFFSLDSRPDTLLENDDLYFGSRDVVYPGSMCEIDDAGLFCRSDTCYFFLIKWSDAKKYSWDEIRDNKMFHTWILTKNKKGEYDTNIRYSD